MQLQPNNLFWNAHLSNCAGLSSVHPVSTAENTRAALPFTDVELTATEVSKDIIALLWEGDFVHSVPEVAVF